MKSIRTPHGPWSIDDFASDVARLTAAEGGGAVIVGVGLGAATALSLAMLVGVLCGFKIVTIGLIFVLAQPNANLGPMLFAMNWVWLIPLALLLSVVPFAFWFRLLRARSKRRRLERSEWLVENAPGW